MTDTNTLAPADAEILDAAEDFRSQYTHGGTTFDEFDEIGFARTVLAKWGTPAPVGVKPVAWRAKVGDLTFHAASREGLIAQLAASFKAAPDSLEPLYTAGQVLAVGQVPVGVAPAAFMHDAPNRFDVIHAVVKKLLHDAHDAAGHLLRPLDKSERYSIPLYIAPQVLAMGRVPLTEAEILYGWHIDDVAPSDAPESLFEAGVRYAERHHGIKQGGQYD